MAVQVDPHARPVQPRRDLFDMGRLAGAVIALDHDPAVVGKAGQDRQRGVVVEAVGVVDQGHALAGLREALDHHVRVDPEGVANRDIDRRNFRRIDAAVSHFDHSCHIARPCGP